MMLGRFLIFLSVLAFVRADDATVALNILSIGYNRDLRVVDTGMPVSVLPVYFDGAIYRDDIRVTLTRSCNYGSSETKVATFGEIVQFESPFSGASVSCSITGSYLVDDILQTVESETFVYDYDIGGLSVTLVSTSEGEKYDEVHAGNTFGFITSAIDNKMNPITDPLPVLVHVSCAAKVNGTVDDTKLDITKMEIRQQMKITLNALATFSPDESYVGDVCEVRATLWTHGKVWQSATAFKVTEQLPNVIDEFVMDAAIDADLVLHMLPSIRASMPDITATITTIVDCGLGADRALTLDVAEGAVNSINEVLVSRNVSDYIRSLGLSGDIYCGLSSTISAGEANDIEVSSHFTIDALDVDNRRDYALNRIVSFHTVDSGRYAVLPMIYSGQGVSMSRAEGSSNVGIYRPVFGANKMVRRQQSGDHWENVTGIIVPTNDYTDNEINMVLTAKESGYYRVTFSSPYGGHRTSVLAESYSENEWKVKCGGINCCMNTTKDEPGFENPFFYMVAGMTYRLRFYATMGCYGSGKGLDIRMNVLNSQGQDITASDIVQVTSWSGDSISSYGTVSVTAWKLSFIDNVAAGSWLSESSMIDIVRFTSRQYFGGPDTNAATHKSIISASTLGAVDIRAPRPIMRAAITSRSGATHETILIPASERVPQMISVFTDATGNVFDDYSVTSECTCNGVTVSTSPATLGVTPFAIVPEIVTTGCVVDVVVRRNGYPVRSWVYDVEIEEGVSEYDFSFQQFPVPGDDSNVIAIPFFVEKTPKGTVIIHNQFDDGLEMYLECSDEYENHFEGERILFDNYGARVVGYNYAHEQILTCTLAADLEYDGRAYSAQSSETMTLRARVEASDPSDDDQPQPGDSSAFRPIESFNSNTYNDDILRSAIIRGLIVVGIVVVVSLVVALVVEGVMKLCVQARKLDEEEAADADFEYEVEIVYDYED